MWLARCSVVAALLLFGIGISGCSDDTEKLLDTGVTDTTLLPDGPTVDKKIYLDAPPFFDQGPDMVPDTTAADAPLPDAPLPDKSCGTGKIACNCYYKGIKLYGKVKYVTIGEDIKIREVSSFPDLKVEKVTSFANKCGQWKEDTFPDFKVRVVSIGEDIKVKYVTSFPGL